MMAPTQKKIVATLSAHFRLMRLASAGRKRHPMNAPKLQHSCHETDIETIMGMTGMDLREAVGKLVHDEYQGYNALI
jgi:hypothetical protein